MEPDPGWNGNYILWFSTVTGRTYTIQTSTDLEQWTDTMQFYGNDDLQAISLPGPHNLEPYRFFRIRIETF